MGLQGRHLHPRFNPEPFQPGTPSLFTHQFQAKPCRCSRRVASITERIDLGCASNLMRVLIKLTAAITAERMIFGKVLNYLKAFCVVIQKNYGATKGTSSLSDNTPLNLPSSPCHAFLSKRFSSVRSATHSFRAKDSGRKFFNSLFSLSNRTKKAYRPALY